MIPNILSLYIESHSIDAGLREANLEKNSTSIYTELTKMIKGPMRSEEETILGHFGSFL